MTELVIRLKSTLAELFRDGEHGKCMQFFFNCPRAKSYIVHLKNPKSFCHLLYFKLFILQT